MSGLALTTGIVSSLAVVCGALRIGQYAVQNPSCSWLAPSITHGSKSKPYIALTFDDGPSEASPDVLSLLKKYDIKATFFQCGANIARLPEVARQIAAAGHEIGNHTYSHPRFCFLSERSMHRELTITQEIITTELGTVPRSFRPPYGLRGYGLKRVQEGLGLNCVLWSVIGMDWIWPTHKIITHVRKGLENGAIVCLHDGRALSPNPDISSTLGALIQLLPIIADHGFKCVTLDTLLHG